MTNSHKARLTLDMDSEEHAYLKMACAKLGVSMRQFILLGFLIGAIYAESFLKQKLGKMGRSSNFSMAGIWRSSKGIAAFAA